MDASRLDRLSERQRECLRLVHASFEAKEIAARLGISPHTVNQHLRDARTTLGAARSIDAARFLASHEGSKRVMIDPIGIDASPPSGENEVAIGPAAPVTIARNRYDLGLLQRIGLIIAVAFVAVAFVGGLVVAIDVVTQILQDHQVDLSDPPYRQ